MSKLLDELMEKNLISENETLSQMIQDIVPLEQEKFTNLEIEANKKQEFSVVVYKKDNLLVRFFKNIRFSLEKLRIMRHAREFDLSKNDNRQ